jgi:uncharacterized membrane protein
VTAVRRAAVALAAGAIAAQIVYPLVTGATRRTVTLLVVVLFFAASVAAAWVRHGAGGAGRLVLVGAGGGLLAESVGLATGLPFGRYAYADSLGPRLLGVPVVVCLAWAMMAYPALVAARALTERFVAPVGGVALASWDLFLDPQMVAEGHWSWASPSPALPGIPGVPVGNFLGWLVVGTLLSALLHRALPSTGDAAAEPVPATLYLWTYASSVLASAVFFGRPGVAAWGAIGMGIVAVPYALRLRASSVGGHQAAAAVTRR